MRIVYDDTRQNDLTSAVDEFMSRLVVQNFIQHEYGMNRVQMQKIKKDLNKFLSRISMEIGNKVTHANGIGNNCQYPVYCHEKDEIQHCAYININTGMFGEGYISCEDYNGKRIGNVYKIDKIYGVRRSGANAR